MFNRILKRPMFRRGGPSYGAQGTGITSGLDQPRRGLVRHPGGYAGDFGERVEEIKETNVLPSDTSNIGFMRGVSTMGAYDPDKPRTIGQMIYDASSAKSKFVDEKEAAVLERAKALENAELSDLSAEGLLEKELASKEKIALMNLKDNKTFMQLEVNKEIGRLYDIGTDIEKQIKKALEDPAYKGKSLPPDHPLMVQQRRNDLLLKDIQKKNSIISNMTEYQLDQAYKDALARAQKEEKELALKEGRDAKKVNKLDVLKKMYETIGTWEGATGGRVGLQASYPGTVADAQMSETIQTPDETVNVTENVQTDANPERATQDLSYEELRARLPREITDDIVKLLAGSEQALLQFANIRTQQDVDSFNQTYSVQLILPQES